MLHERRLSRSSRSRDLLDHLREAEVEGATRLPQRYRHHAIGGTWRRECSKGHNVREGRATWRQSIEPKRCRSAFVYRLSWACLSIGPMTQCLRSTAIGYLRFRSVLSYRTYAGYAWITLAKMTFRTKPSSSFYLPCLNENSFHLRSLCTFILKKECHKLHEWY